MLNVLRISVVIEDRANYVLWRIFSTARKYIIEDSTKALKIGVVEIFTTKYTCYRLY